MKEQLKLPTQSELDAIRERHAATTQHDWIADISRPGPSGARCPRESVIALVDMGINPTRIASQPPCDRPPKREMVANFEFIAAAHQDVPMLLDAYEAVTSSITMAIKDLESPDISSILDNALHGELSGDVPEQLTQIIEARSAIFRAAARLKELAKPTTD